jgi:hypothetical protein
MVRAVSDGFESPRLRAAAERDMAMRLAPVLLSIATVLAASPALAQSSPPTIMQGGFSSTPTLMQGGFPNAPATGFSAHLSAGGFPRPFFPPVPFGMHHRFGGDFRHRFGGHGVGRFWPGFPVGLPYGYGAGLGYGYNYDSGGTAPSQEQPVVLLNTAPPPPPPVSVGVTTETTPAGVTIVRGHTQY